MFNKQKIDFNENPDIWEFLKMLNKEEFYFPQFPWEWYDKLWYNRAWRYIKDNIDFNIKPWTVEIIRFTPINIHSYQNFRAGNIISFIWDRKKMFWTEKVAFIWQEWSKNNEFVEMSLNDYSVDEISEYIDQVHTAAEEFVKRTGSYIYKLWKYFWYYSPQTWNGRFAWYDILNWNIPKLIFSNETQKYYYEDVLFKIRVTDDITNNTTTKLYTVNELFNILN